MTETRAGSPSRITAQAIFAAIVGLLAIGVALSVQRPPSAGDIEQANQIVGAQPIDVASTPPNSISASAPDATSPITPSATTDAATPVASAPTPFPTAVPSPVPTRPAPTATAVPAAPQLRAPRPLQPSPDAEFAPQLQSDERISVVLQGLTSFALPRPLPVQVFEGHAIVYLDDSYVGEVDLLVPYRTADGRRLFTYDDVLAHIETDAKFREFSPPLLTDVNGIRAATYFGIANEFELGFMTGREANGVDQLGWFMPAQMWLWVLDGPDGPIVVTGELLSESPREAEVSALLAEVLQSIIFHP